MTLANIYADALHCYGTRLHVLEGRMDDAIVADRNKWHWYDLAWEQGAPVRLDTKILKLNDTTTLWRPILADAWRYA